MSASRRGHTATRHTALPEQRPSSQMNCLGRSAGWFVGVLLAFVLLPAAASADAPVAQDESVQIANPTTVPLEATTTGTTEMTFAIASSRTRGSLGQISSPTCQPTG